MRKDCKSICWAIVLISFHLNIGVIQIVPGFVGWIMIAIAINNIFIEQNEGFAKKAKKLSTLFAILTTFLTVIEYIGLNLGEIPVIPMIVIPFCEMILFYEMIQAMGERCEGLQVSVQTYLNMYLSFNTIGILVNASYYIFYNSSLVIIALLILLLLRLSLIIVVRDFDRMEREEENLELVEHTEE